MNKKPLVALVAILVVLLIGGFVWWHGRERGSTTELVLYGNVDIRQVSLAFEGSGRVAELRAEEGDTIKAGAVLAVLDTRTLALQAEQAKAQIEVQQQNLLRLRNGARPQEIAQARSRSAEAQADAARAEQRAGAAAGNRCHHPGPRRESPGSGSRQDKRAGRPGPCRGTAQATRLTELGPRAEEVSGAAAQLRASQAQLALLQHQIGQGELKAPADAVVRSRLLEPGDMATPQRPVFALALASRNGCASTSASRIWAR